MIHKKLIDKIADHLVQITGYDKELIFESNQGRECADMKTWLITITAHKNFSYDEISDYLGMSRDGAYKCGKRHMQRLKDEDYRMKWDYIEEEFILTTQ